MASSLFIIDISPDGIVATHPVRAELPVLVAPVPEEQKKDKFNRIRPHLVTIGCMMIPGKPGFEFDSSLISPGAEKKLTKFASMMQAMQKQDSKSPKRFPPCSIFGHADPTGNDEYNKELSARRARAVYALLTRNKKIWDNLFNVPHGGDKWGYKAVQFMLSTSLNRKANEPPFFTGPLDGAKTPETRKQTQEALNAYQESRGLAKTPFANEKTREKLFEEYMNAICHDEKGEPFILDPVENFLARKKNAKLRGDVQGCSEFNPVFLLSDAEEKLFKDVKEFKEARDALYNEDRRVLIYVFSHDSEIEPDRWPCPVADQSESTSRCRDRFWSNAEERLTRGEEQRRFKDTRDTMACRFYHAFAFNSPCEAGVRLWVIRFRVEGFLKKQPDGKFINEPLPLANRRFVLQAGPRGDAAVIRGTTDERGEIRIPVFDENVLMTLKLDAWGDDFKFADESSDTGDPAAPPVKKSDPSSGFDTDRFPDEDKFMTLTLDAGALKKMDEGDDAAKQRLYNLGFGQKAPLKWDDKEFRRAVKAYRKMRQLGEQETLDGPTREKLLQEHDLENAPKLNEEEKEPVP